MSSPWKPYTPSRTAPWNVRRVVHLHRRAGFAAAWPEIRRDRADGPQASIDRLLAGRSREAPGHYAARVARLEELAVASGRPADLRAAWIYRMLHGPDPLGERLTLLWHNHFATSNEKVRDFRAMLRQNAIFRKHACGSFGELLSRLIHDPALLVYLDAQDSRKEHPNENLARELMELFTLGVGHYTEADVKEAARALTGWGVQGPADNEVRAMGDVGLERWLRTSADRHDAGVKTVLGRRGRWSADDLVKILIEQPATADRLAWRIAGEFLGEGVAPPEELAALADQLRSGGLDVGKAVALVLRSERFFGEAAMGRRVMGPVEWVVSAARRLGPLADSCSPLQLGEWVARLGQDLFYPPNVGGWPGGRAWLSPLALLGRANLAADLMWGRLTRPVGAPLDLLGLARASGRGGSREEVTGFFTDLILGTAPDAGWTGRVVAAAGAGRELPEFARRAAAVILASPEAQLG